jgi:hypothetical protein
MINVAIVSILTFVGQKVLDKIVEDGVDLLKDILKKKSNRKQAEIEFENALSEAIYRFGSSNNRHFLMLPLVSYDSPLKKPETIQELAKLFYADEEPDYQAIGVLWHNSMSYPPSWIDFTLEAQTLVRFLLDELRETQIFGPILARQDVHEIRVNADKMVNGIAALENLTGLINTNLEGLLVHFLQAQPGIGEYIRDFSWLIEEHTREFTGRQFLFDDVDSFIKTNSCGYYFLRTDPGVGKTAFTAQLVRSRGYLHHFNNISAGVVEADKFLQNICAQLIARYLPNEIGLPKDAASDGLVFSALLEKISRQLSSGEKIVIAIDALDEAEKSGTQFSQANLLFLPKNLPEKVYIIATSRRLELPLTISCGIKEKLLDSSEIQNMADIRAYIEFKSNQSNLHSVLARQQIPVHDFVNVMTECSQGNFQYLRFVLPEYETGVYKNLVISQLPLGLKSYYESHWRRMKGENENSWFLYKLPVLVALTVVKNPISLQEISQYSGVNEFSRIMDVLREWRPFLIEQKLNYKGQMLRSWRFYHETFREFIYEKDEVEAEKIGLAKANARIANLIWEDFNAIRG